MREQKIDLQFVTARASGWCEPDTGVCPIDTVEEAASATTSDEGDHTSDAPDATGR